MRRDCHHLRLTCHTHFRARSARPVGSGSRGRTELALGEAIDTLSISCGSKHYSLR